MISAFRDFPFIGLQFEHKVVLNLSQLGTDAVIVGLTEIADAVYLLLLLVHHRADFIQPLPEGTREIVENAVHLLQLVGDLGDLPQCIVLSIFLQRMQLDL